MAYMPCMACMDHVTVIISGVDAGRRRSSAEGIAAVDVARAAAGQEPVTPLLGGPVGPGLGVHPALRLLLDPVVADRLGRPDGLVQLGLADRDVATDVGEPAPDAGVAVGLQLNRDR